MRANFNQKKFLTPREAATLLGVSTETVRRWCSIGKLEAKTTLGGHRRFRFEDVEKLLDSDIAPQQNKNAVTPNTSTDVPTKILIVEDDQQYANFLKELLLSFSRQFIIEIAHNGFEAGCILATFKPEIVLVDLVMPDINGIQLCQLIRTNQKTADVRIIAITGHNSSLNARNFINVGVEAVLEKPVDERLLFSYLFSNQIKSIPGMCP